MCGISCVLDLDGQHTPKSGVRHKTNSDNLSASTVTADDDEFERSSLSKSLEASLDKIKHRGPDSRGQWISPDNRVALGHVRLAINDLSQFGNQPFHSADNKLHAVVNGELYNDELWAELKAKGHPFQGHCDCEIVIAAYQEYGLGFLSLLRGEFALCLWDEQRRLFLAARDRYGIKPLFYTFAVRNGRRTLLVAAEAKAFLSLGWEAEWDVESLVQGGWNFDERTVFKGVRKLKPGHFLTMEDFGEINEQAYWDIEYPDKRIEDARDVGELIDGVRRRLLEAVRVRLKADVPVGIYLSGGIDSSAIAGMVTHLVRERGERIGNANETEKVSCFTIAFDESSGVNESDVAIRTAEHLGVKLYKKHMSESELAERFEAATYHCEHQNFDLNYVGKFALSELPPERGFKVVLTGEGSDENFAGYPLYLPDYLRELDLACPDGRPPEDVRHAALERASSQMAEAYTRMGATVGERSELVQRSMNHLSTPAAMTAFHPSLFAAWTTTAFGNSSAQDTIARGIDDNVRLSMREKWHPLHSAMYTWTKGHLANQFLTCLGDRGEMAHSLEARTPFLDHHLTEYVAGIAPSWKIRYQPSEHEAEGKFVEKWILREAAKPFVTEELYGRTKQAYTAPTKYPPNGPLHKLFARLVTPDNVEQLGFVDSGRVDGLLERAFRDQEPAALRQLITVAQWVVLKNTFGLPRATPPSS